MRNAQAGPNIDDEDLDGDSGDMVWARASRDVPPPVACASLKLGEAVSGTVALVEGISK